MSAWASIGVEPTLPPINTDPVGAFALPADHNVIELSGQGPVTGGLLYLLRKVVYPSGDYQFVPYAPDKPIVCTSLGWFSARYYVGQAGGSAERFCIYNPSGLNLAATLARGQVY